MQEFTVKKMRAGRGVRDEGLLAIRGTGLGRRLGVSASDDALTVLVKVSWQVERVIGEVSGDPRSRRVLRYSFNTPRVHALNRLATQKERLEFLARDGGPGKSTSDRLVSELSEAIEERWGKCEPPPIPAVEFALWRQWEQDHARIGSGTIHIEVDADDFEQSIHDWMTGGRARVERRLLFQELYFDLVDGTVPSVRTKSGVHYVSVFTRPEHLAEFRRETSAPPGRQVVVPGLELLRRLRATGVGLALNPLVRGGGKSYWTPDEVAALVPRGEG
ncbi:hypothetical protein AB0G02_09565 [Actinosynnema sp. NPDC023658]|uniref:hypothetical protein n=1 Tax=Actinosynnema sp. NPDC023658 TaxID=3155465 RepID=UPI0033D23B17